jgi:hypothetical protein
MHFKGRGQASTENFTGDLLFVSDLFSFDILKDKISFYDDIERRENSERAKEWASATMELPGMIPIRKWAAETILLDQTKNVKKESGKFRARWKYRGDEYNSKNLYLTAGEAYIEKQLFNSYIRQNPMKSPPKEGTEELEKRKKQLRVPFRGEQKSLGRFVSALKYMQAKYIARQCAAQFSDYNDWAEHVKKTISNIYGDGVATG